jgi:hypothetical protein
MKYFTLALAILLLPQLCFGGSDVCIHLNGGDDVVYNGEWNTLEVWIENDYDLESMMLSFEISWHSSVSISWNMSHGTWPPVQQHGRAINAFDMFFLANHDFDNVSADHISLMGLAQLNRLPAGPSELCYSLEFMATAPAEVPIGFCVQPFDYNTTPPEADWFFYDYVNGEHAPDFCGIPVTDIDNPVAPPACFDVTQPAYGDCDNNGTGGTVADFVYLLDYLFQDGPPPPDPDACDCDNYPGVNYGDFWQLNMHYQNPSYLLYGSPGEDYMTMAPPVKFLVAGRPTGEVPGTDAKILSKGWRSGTTCEVECMMLVLSFAAGPGEADLNCTGIDFAGSAATNLTGDYDNVSKTLWIFNSDTPVMNAWDQWDLVATAHFVPDPAGSPGVGVELVPTVSGAWNQRRSILLLKAAYADGTTLGDRVSYVLLASVDPLNPLPVGNVDCDEGGVVDIDDVVYLIEWIFMGGPPPGDPDDDGVPDC